MENNEIDLRNIHKVNLNKSKNFLYDIKVPVIKPTTSSNTVGVFSEEKTIKEKVSANNKNSHKKLYLVTSIFLVLFLLASSLTFYFYKKSKSTQHTPNSQEEYLASIKEINKIALLPDANDTSATLSVVLNPEEAKADPDPSFKFFNFFENAAAGDYLLHFPKVGKYILYRPSTHQIINMLTIPASILNASEETIESTTSATTTAQ